MEATRNRKLRFIEGHSGNALERYVLQMLRRKESTWLTDEQIDEITSKMVDDDRFEQHLKIKNRRIARPTSEPPMFRDWPKVAAE